MNSECNNKTCPWQGGNSLSGKTRRLIHDPEKILGDYIEPGMLVLDVGCGMGFMAVAAAGLVGEPGRVVLVDIQREMLDGAMERLQEAGFEQRGVAIQCRQKSLSIDEYNGIIDFAYAFMMVHEAENKDLLLSDLFNALRPGGSLLVAEPYIHVAGSDFRDSIKRAQDIGFEVEAPKRKINICRTVLLKKPAFSRH